MSHKRYLRPAPGRQVRDPFTGEPLPADGREVEFNTYYRRRLRDGDVLEGTPPQSPPPQKLRVVKED